MEHELHALLNSFRSGQETKARIVEEVLQAMLEHHRTEALFVARLTHIVAAYQQPQHPQPQQGHHEQHGGHYYQDPMPRVAREDSRFSDQHHAYDHSNGYRQQ